MSNKGNQLSAVCNHNMSKTSYTNQQLVNMIRGSAASRDQAFYYIFHHSGWVRRAEQLLQKDSFVTDIDEAIQEALVALDNHIRNFNYKEDMPLSNYFLGICKGRIFSNRRSQQKLTYTDQYYKLDKIDRVDPEIIMLQKEQKSLIRSLLKQLGEPCKTALQLYQLSYSMKEIGVALGKSEQMAKKINFNCRKKLKALMESSPNLIKEL